MDGLVDHKAFDLVEHRRVRRVPVLAVDAAGRDHADRRFRVQHRAHLDRRGVRAQEFPRAVGCGLHEEGVVHLPRRMAGREVERGEVVEVVLDVGTFSDGEAHVGEDGGEFLEHLHHGMQRADRLEARRQGEVFAFGFEARIQRRRFEVGLARIECCGEAILEAVEGGAGNLALLRAHAAELAHQKRDAALLAQFGNADGIERCFVRRRGDRLASVRLDLCNLLVDSHVGLVRGVRTGP